MKCTSLKCALTEFWQLYVPNPATGYGRLSSPQKVPLWCSSQRQPGLIFFPPCNRLVLLILDFHVSGLIECTVLWKASFTQHSIFGISSLLYLSVVCSYLLLCSFSIWIFCRYSPIDGHLGCLKFSIMNKAYERYCRVLLVSY